MTIRNVLTFSFFHLIWNGKIHYRVDFKVGSQDPFFVSNYFSDIVSGHRNYDALLSSIDLVIIGSKNCIVRTGL